MPYIHPLEQVEQAHGLRIITNESSHSWDSKRSAKKLSHGCGDLDWQPDETFYFWSTCIFFPICVKRGNPPQCRHANAESILSYCCYNIDIEITWSSLDAIWRDMILWYSMMRYTWTHVEMVGHGVFACLGRCASRLKSKLCSMLSVRDTPVSTQRDVKIFPILCHFCIFLCGIHVHPTMQRAT